MNHSNICELLGSEQISPFVPLKKLSALAPFDTANFTWAFIYVCNPRQQRIYRVLLPVLPWREGMVMGRDIYFCGLCMDIRRVRDKDISKRLIDIQGTGTPSSSLELRHFTRPR